LLILLLGILNAALLILPRTVLSANQPYQTAIRIAAETDNSDVIFVKPNDITMLTISYFAQRRVLPAPTPITKISDLPNWIAAEAQNISSAGGRLLVLQADGKLREITPNTE